MRRPHSIVDDMIVKVENCYFSVDLIIMDMKSMKDFTNSPIILGRPFLATAKAITNWGKRKSHISGRRYYDEGEHQQIDATSFT